MKTIKTVTLAIVLLALIIMVQRGTANAQTTEFTYQGKLTVSSAAASGNFDFEFLLFDALSGGTQIGSTNTRSSVAVSAGVFTVNLDFGPEFPGAARFIEIHVRQTGVGAFTPLAPRQAISNAPYAVKSLNADTAASATNADTANNALQLGGVNADQFVQTGDARLSDARSPLPGSPNYIQNGTSAQASSNFNVSGTGTANILNAATQYNLGGNRVLSIAGISNTFAGVEAGSANTTGNSNNFFGTSAGKVNTTGSRNAFFGIFTGFKNTTGNGNSFFGRDAGANNTTANDNAFFGEQTGQNNVLGEFNAFFGAGAGFANTTGNNNAFFGVLAGTTNSSGSNNTLIGKSANVGVGNLSNATAIGAFAIVSQSNSMVLGSINGVNSATADTNVGIGTTAPDTRFQVIGNTKIATSTVLTQASRGNLDILSNTGNANFYMQGGGGTSGINFGVAGNGTGNATMFIAQYDGTTYIDRLRLNPNGNLEIYSLGAAGSTPLCQNSFSEISTCSSSIRYKDNIRDFTPGLDLIRKLRVVSFNWKADNKEDLGLVAEEVNAVEPLLTTTNDKGEIEGVKYDRVGVVLVNAIKEQQTQIEQQQKQIELQKIQIESLIRIVCTINPKADICRQ